MPFSHSSQISTVVQYIEALGPQSLLDVGVGMGQYGFLARTNLENLNLFQVNGKVGRQRSREDWNIRIDGIEGCDVYVTPVHEYVYNNLMIGDALDILPTLPESGYDLVLAIDILEHLNKEDGCIFMEHLKRVACKAALISTPKNFIPQEVEANPYENHLSVWSRKELVRNNFTQILANDISWIAVYEV